MGRRRLGPFETEITTLGKGGTGVGLAPDGKDARCRFAPPGSRVRMVPMGRKKGTWLTRRLALVRPPADYVAPPCPVFTLCGGCALQELELSAQRRHKERWALEQVGPTEATVHPVRGVPEPYGFRNKVELSFGPTRWVSEADMQRGVPLDGRFLGFHAPGRWDRIVDVERCHLISDRANAALTVVREHALRDDAPPPRHPREHTGFWRHLVLREGFRTGDLLVMVVTTSPSSDAEARAVQEVAKAVDATGVLWVINDGVAEVARGEIRQVWGREWLEERLGDVTYRLGPFSFFQTSTVGAELLYDTIGEALGPAGTLYDLYCGTGTIGLYLADRFDRVVGVEVVEQAVEDARANAVRNGVEGVEFRAAKMEDALDVLPSQGSDHVLLVDPPRAGLHPKVTKALSQAPGEHLVYVACNPGSLGRDRPVLAEGGWELTDLWVVDLFPQTGHVEVVGRFSRASPGRTAS